LLLLVLVIDVLLLSSTKNLAVASVQPILQMFG
jgi:hypothetical protein